MKNEHRFGSVAALGSVAVLVAMAFVGCSSSDDTGSTANGGSSGSTHEGGAADNNTGTAGKTTSTGGSVNGEAGNASAEGGNNSSAGGIANSNTEGGNAMAAGGSAEGGAGAEPGACNALQNIGKVVKGTANAAALPKMTGGKVHDGTYVLTSNVSYAGHSADTKTHKRTLLVNGATVQLVNSDDGGLDIHATISVAPMTNELNDSLTCPIVGGTPNTFTATPNSLALLKHGDNQVETYTMQ